MLAASFDLDASAGTLDVTLDDDDLYFRTNPDSHRLEYDEGATGIWKYDLGGDGPVMFPFATDFTITIGTGIEGTDTNLLNDAATVYLAGLETMDTKLTVTSAVSLEVTGDINTGKKGLTLEVSDTINIAGGTLAHTQSNITIGATTPPTSDADLDGDGRVTVTAGEVTITATQTEKKSQRQIIGVDNNTTAVTVTRSDISGDVVTIGAYSEDLTYSDEMPQWYSHIDGLVNNFIDGVIPIPNSMGVFVREASASVDVDDSNILSNGDLTIESDSQAHASMVALATRSAGIPKIPNAGLETFVQQFSFGFSKATGSAKTNIKGDSKLLATGNISVTATTDVIAKVSARTTTNISRSSPANPGSLSASVGITLSDTTATVDIGEDVTVTSQEGDVELQATSDVENTSSATAASYIDGMGGVTFAYGNDTAKVTTDVQGVVSSHGTQESNHVFDTGDVGPDGILNEITIPNHDYEDGDVVEYVASLPTGTSGTPEPIGDLINGESLQVIVIDSNTIQLQRGEELDLSLPPGDADSTHSLSPSTSLQFDPQAMSPHPAVNTTDHTISLGGNDFVTGQAVKYVVTPPTESTPATDTTPEIEAVPSTPIGADSSDDAPVVGALYSDTIYYVIVVDAGLGSFRLAETYEDALSDVGGDRAVAFTNSGAGHEHYFVYETDAIPFQPDLAVNETTNTIDVLTTGIETGDALVYRPDPDIQTERGISRNYGFVPDGVTNLFDPTGTIDFGEPVLDPSVYTLTIENHGWSKGEQVAYDPGSLSPMKLSDGSSLPGGMYYVIVIDADTIQLASEITSGNPGPAIEIVSAPEPGDQQLGGESFDPSATVQWQVADPVDNTVLFETPHGLVTGQRVTYSPGQSASGQPNLPIGGLVAGENYYVITISDYEIQLSLDRINNPQRDVFDGLVSVDDGAVDLGSGAMGSGATGSADSLHQFFGHTVDMLNDWIISPNHELETGQAVTYNAGDGTAIGGLIDGTTYYAIRLDGNTIRLADSLEDASTVATTPSYLSLDSAGTGTLQTLTTDSFVFPVEASRTEPVVDTTAKTIELVGHGLTHHQKVNYQSSGGDAIGGLADNTDYYVLTDSLADPENHIQLAAVGLPGTAISLDLGATLGSGLHLFRVIPDVELYNREDPVIVFDPTVVPPFAMGANTLRVPGHGLSTDDSVRYLTGGGEAIGGLTNGADYLAVVVDDNHLQFTELDESPTPTNAIAFTSQPGDGAVHGVQVQSTVTQNDLPVTGLGSGLTYYAIVDGPNALRLAESPPEVLNALPITFDTSTTNADTVHTLVEKSGIIVGSTLTASNKQNAGSALGSEPTFNDFVNKGEVMFSAAVFSTFSYFKLKEAQDLFAGTSPVSNDGFAIAASAAVNDVSHTVRTTVGNEASTRPLTQLTSDGDITIEATIEETSQVKSQGNVVPGPGKEFAGGFAFAIGLYENTAETTVEGNARIDAAADVSIASDVAYPLVIKVKQLDPFYDCTTDTVGDGCHPITDLATALDGSGGLTRILNTWSNTKAFTNNSDNLPDVAFTLSVGLNVYDNNSTATIKTGAKINQGLDLQAASSTQTVTLSADTTQQFVTLAGIMHLRVNFKELGRFKAEPKDGNNAISFFGNKSGSFGFGGSTMLQFLDNTTAAVVEEGVSIHTDTSGSGLTVEANETVHSTQIAQSGSDSDKGAVAASAVYAGHESTTVAQVDAGAIIDGGALNITSSSDVITEAVTGGFSWGPIGIGMSGGVVNVNRHTGAFTGRRKWSDEYADELPYGSAAGVDLPAALGTLTVAGLAVTAANNGVTGNFSIVGAGAVGRESSNPIVEEFKEEDINEQIDKDRNALQGSSKIGDGDLPIDDDKSAFAFAGDAAVNLVSDIADAQIDVAGFSEVTIGSDGGGDLEVTATDDTLHWAFSGAGAYAGASEGTAVAFAGSFAVNSLDVYTEAHLRDTSTPERDSLVPVNVSGDVLVTAEAAQSTVAEDAFGVWAISGSLGVSSADDKHWSTAAALNMSINLVTTETTRASIGNVGLTAAAGSITIDAQNHRSMNADGGAFDVSLKKAKELRPEPGAAGAAGGSVAVGGSNSINKIENLTVDALVDNNTAITSESLTVNAYANPNIRAVTVSGSVSAANAEVSINGSESGSVNEINRKVMARIGDEDKQTVVRGSAGTLAVSGDVKVVAKDESTILAVSGGIAFSLDTSPKGTFTGLAGFAWSHNWLDEECQVLAKIVGFTVGSDVATPGTVDVKASSAPSIKTYVIQLGVLASRGGVVDANITGAISKNQIDGSDSGSDSGNVTAGIQNSVVDALDSVNVCADDESAIHATIWAAGLTVSADLFELHVGINYGENEYGSKLAAEIVNSTVTAAGGDVSVQAVSNPDLFTEVGNANVDIQFLDSENKLKETPVSISVSDIGTFATNTVSNTVASSIDNSSVGAGGSLVVRADDKAAIESKSFGNQVGFSLSLTGGKDLSLDVGAITQFATNEVSTDLSALITNSPANPIGGSAITADGALSVTATKQQSVQAHMETTSVGVGISTTGMAINLSAATSVVHNSVGIDEHSRTYASIDNTFLEAAAVTVSAEARPSLYTKIWDVDVQVAGGATAAVAALYGESKAVNTLKEDVQATIKKGSKVTASSGSIKVLANLLPTDLPDPDPNYSRYSPPPQTNIYADTHSVGVSMAIAAPGEGVPIAFAGAVILSDTVSTSQSKVIAKVEDSDLDAYTDISVSSNDNTTVYAVARDTSVAISDALSVAVAVPKAEQTIENTVQATVESTSDGQSEMDIVAQNGDIDVTATSGAHVKTETTVWSASIGAVSVSDSSSTTTSKISDEASLEAAVIGNGGANRLHLQAPQGSANVRSRFDGHSESSIHSGAVSASIGGSVDTVISSSVTSPTVFAFIEGVTTVEAFENVVVQADAEGHAQNESKQTSVGVVFAGSGLNQNSTADPEVSAWIGDSLSAYDNQAQWRPSFETTVEGDEGITLRAQSFIDAATESQMIGGSIGITVLSPESHATVSPTVKVEVGPGTHLKSLNAIEIEAFGGLDQSPRPSTFDASRIDDDENTIEYADLHRLQTGNVVKYLTGVDENEVNNDLVSGLESGKEYQVIVVNDKLVQLGSQIESSQASVDVDTDQLRFNSRVNFQQQFTPVSDLTGTADTWERVVTQDNLNSNWQSIVQSWDKVIYQPVSPAPEDAIEGLKPDATSYRVNRVADDAIMLWEADVDLPVPWVITDETVQADGSFQFTDHKFEDGQHVTYRAADPISFSSGLVNQTVTLSTDNGDPDLSGDPESDPSNTIYLGNGVNRFYDDNGFIDDMIVEYRVEAAPNTWYWTEGPTPAPESDDTTEPADAFHSLTGTQFWAGGSSSQGGSVVGNAYVNWAVDTPSLTSVDNHYATIDNSGLWRDDAGTALQSNQYVIEYPQFVLFPNEDGMSQQAAKIFAKGKGGWLPSITSQEEWQQAKTAAADNRVWLGGSDDAREDTWVWDGGGQDPEHGKQFWDGGKNGSSTLSPAPPWQDGEPNDGGSFTAVRNRETGLEMLSGGYWNDEDKDTHHTAILVEFPRYKIITTLRDGKTSFNFPEAHEDAQNRKGWIATIGSQDDNDLITGLMTDNTEPAWIGASNDQIIGGLEDGGRYKVGLAADTHNHPQSIQLYPLTGDAPVIAIDNSGLASSVNHTFVSIRELPLTRLGSGRTYYVNKIDADSFHLAETVGGSNIMVSGKDTDPDTNDVTKTGQFGFIGTMGVDLTGVGQGLQNLVFDIDDANGTQTLKYVKGLQAKPDGTGTASSYVHAAGGSLVAQSVRPRSTSTASPDVAILLSSGSRVQAARDIDITALSAGNANTSTEAYGGAIVSGAGAHATSMVDHKAKVQLYGNLHANEHLTVESKISDAVEAHADTKSYGALDANALSHTRIAQSFTSLIDVDQGARLSAGDSIELNAYTFLDDLMTSNTHSGALFGTSKANQDDTSGIHIGDPDNASTTEINISRAHLLADEIYLNSRVLGIDTAPDDTDGDVVVAFGGGMQNANQATATVNVNETTSVKINNNAKLVGDRVEITATQQDLNLHTRSHTRRGRAASKSEAEINYTGTSQITSSAGATVVTENLVVQAGQLIDDGDISAVADSDRGDFEPTYDPNSNREIDWNATVLGRRQATLDVDADGTIVAAEGLVVQPYEYVASSAAFPNGFTFAQAQTHAESLGGRLVTIRSAAEQQLLEEFIATQPGTDDFWIGASDEGHEGTWKWLEDEEQDVTFWTETGDELFWTGGASGNAVDNAYSNWGTGYQVIDQSQSLATDGGFGGHLAQSFQPGTNNITGASVRTSPYNSNDVPADITIGLYDQLPGFGGNLLATGTALNVRAGEWAVVDFGGQVSVIPNTTYYLDILSSELAFTHYYGTEEDSYPRGEMFTQNGTVFDHDLAFRTFTEVDIAGPAGGGNDYAALRMSTDDRGNLNSDWITAHADEQRYYVLKTIDDNGSQTLELRKNSARESGTWTWQEALADAASHSPAGTIADVQSAADEERLRELFHEEFCEGQNNPREKCLPDHEYVGLWINASDEVTEGEWTRPVNAFEKWNSGEPNNFEGNENAAQYQVSNHTWNDLDGTQELPFIVEYDQITIESVSFDDPQPSDSIAGQSYDFKISAIAALDVTFTTDTATVKGTPLFYAHAHVDLENHSSRDLVVGDVDLVSFPYSPNVSVISANDNLNYTTTLPAGETLGGQFYARNLWSDPSTATPLLQISGTINNPSGIVELKNLSGDITGGGGTSRGVIEGHEIFIDAPDGAVDSGDSDETFLIRLHDARLLSPNLSVIAGEQLTLDVQAEPDETGRARGVDRLEGSVVDIGLLAWNDYSILQDAPVGYWDLNEKTGTVARDASHSGVNGTYANVTLGVDGPIKQQPDTAVSFSGTGSVTIPDSSSLYGNQAQTVTGWFKVDRLSSDFQPVYFKGNEGTGTTDYTDSGTNRENTFWVTPTGQLHFSVTFTDSSAQEALTTAEDPVEADTWYHFATVADLVQGKMSVYLNGELLLTHDTGTDHSIQDTPGAWWLGQSPSGSELYGALDDFAIFNTVLSEDQIARQYDAGIADGPYPVDTHYVIDGFVADLQLDALHREIRSAGNLTITGRDADGTPLAGAVPTDSLPTVQIQAHVEIADLTTGQLTVTTNGDIHLSEGVDYIREKIDGTFSYAQAFTDAGTNGRWLTTISDSDEQRIVRTVAEGEAVWFGANDVRLEGDWNWVAGEVLTTPFYLGDYRTGNLLTEGSELTEHSEIREALADVYTNWAVDPQGFQTQPVNSYSNENFAVMRSDGFWDDVAPVWDAPSVQSEQVSWLDAVRQFAPVGFWRLGEAAGEITAVDLNNTINGTYSGVTLGVAGAISYDGNTAAGFGDAASNSHVSIPDNIRLHGDQAQTVTGWFQVDDLDETWQAVYFKGDPGNNPTDYINSGQNRENTFWVNSSGYLYMAMSLKDGSTELTLATEAGLIQPGQWHHFATVIDAEHGELKTYLDGKSVAQLEIQPGDSIRDTGGDWLLGNSPSGMSSLHGLLDEFAIYNTVLTADQIERQYSAGISSGDSEVLFWQGNSTGSAVDGAYTNWNTGEPNNNNDGNSENHVELKVYTDSAGTVSSYWNDVTDDQQQYYVLKTLDVDGNPSFKLRLNEADTEGQKFTWQEALVDAENRGGVVANITKRQDEELFIQLVKDAFSLAQGHPVSVWVNATDELIEGQWRRPVQVRGNPYVLETPQGLDFVDGTFTFANAWFDAYQRGGWVATVNSAEEQESIAALADGREIWLGASDSRSESFWHWLEPAYRDVPFWTGNGTRAPVEDAFTNWNNYPDDGYPSEPNNDGGHEHFGEVSADGGWNDLPVTSTRPYIATTRVIRGAGQTSTLGQTMRVASITSSAGNVWLDAPGDVEIDGVIQTGAENTFTWNGTGQVLNDTADPGSASDLQIISASLQLASIGGLGSEAVPLHTQVQSLHAVVPIHSIYVHNEGNLVAGDLAVSKGDLQIVTEGALEIDGPLSVEGGGYVNLVANGSKTVLGMIEGEFTHAEAAANAITRGGRLAVILTEEDQQAVEDAAAGSMVWIGATDEAREGDWQWSIDASTKESFYAAPVQFWSGDANGLSVNNEYQNWNIGEPNNSNDNENHIELYAAGGSAYGTWNDLNGDQLRHYVLETNGELSLSTLTFTFDGALNDAANRNGHVASITSSEDQQAVLAAAHGNNVWINATDEGHEGEWWRPASGYPVNGHYENWAEGQPDNYQGLEHFGGLRVDGTWNDFTAENTLPYVLEYDTSLIIGAPVFTHGGDGNISLIGSHGVRIETEIQYISGSDVHIGGQDNQVNYAQAKTDAALRNGWLAVLTSDQAIQTALTAIDGRTALAGGTDEGHEGDWRWVDSPMLPEEGVTFWLNGEEQNGLPAYWNNSSPSPEPNGGVNENILEIEGDGSWNDLAAGDLRNGYLLQLPSVYTGGYGQIVITAGTAYDNQLRHGSNTADIWMQDGSSVTSDHGTIALLATQDIWLSNVATSWKTDAASRIGDVLIVADYDGIEGTLFDTVGAIYDNLTGDALNVTARHGVFSAEGAWKNSGHGVGASAKSLHTQINTIAAVTDNGDIAIRNYGDLTVGSVGIQLQGVMSDIDPFTQVVPVQELLQYQSDFYNSKPDLTIPGYFQVGGLAIVKTSGASHETASIDVSAQGSLTAHAAVPILNMTAGHITLKALSDYPLHQLSVTIPVFANGGLQNIHLSGGSEHVPIVVPLSVDSIEWYHHINVESTLLEGGNAEVSISRDENATTLPDTDLRYVFSTVQSDVAAATYADGSTETSYSLELPEDGVQVVFLRVLYPNGQSTDYTSVFTVADVAPTDLAVLTPADPITPGTLQTLTGQFDDLDVNDQHHVTIDWADGTDDAVIDLQNSARSFTGSHTYTAPGRYVATVTVTDIESGKSTSSNTTYFVSGVALQEGTLNIIGTWEYDRIRVNGGRSWTHVVAHMNGLPRQSEWISTSDIQQIMFRPYDEGDRLRTIGPVSFPITQVTVPLSTPSWTTEGNTKTTDEFQPVSWNPVSGATEYQVWYTNVSTGEKPFLLATTTQTTFTPTRALPIGQYNIWVRAQRDSQNSAWGPGLAMRVWSRATLHTPDFQQTSLTPALTWDALSGATSYRIWYDNITTGARQVIDTTVTGTSFTPSQDLGLGKYRVWVAGIAARGMQARWSYPIDFNVGPQTVSPIIPAFTRRPVFEWTSVPETGSYELYIHTRSGVLQPAGISGTSWTPDTDLPSGAFYWWVRGLTDSNIAAPWSERAAGDTDGRTSLITPTGAGYSGTPLFQWQSVQNAATYILHVQRLSDRQVVIRQDSLTTNTHTPATALVSGAYRVWVQAISRTGQPGLWSIPADFTVASVIAPDAAVSPLQHILTVLPTGIPGLLADDDVRTMAASVQSSDGRFTESKAVDSVNKTDTDEASDTETGQTFQTPGMSSEAADRPVTVITEEPEDFTLVDQLMSGLSERKTLPETFLDSSY